MGKKRNRLKVTSEYKQFRRILLVITFIGTMFLIPTLLSLQPGSLLTEKSDNTRYNVLFIAVDDLTITLSTYGDSIAITPNFDRLSRLGVQFNNAYCQIPLCNPSRASLMTGLRPDSTGVFDLDVHFRDVIPDVVTLPQLFKENGYWVGRIGKLYHYDVPAGIGTNGLDDPKSWSEVFNQIGKDKQDEHMIFNAEPHRSISGALSWIAADGMDVEQTDGLIVTEAIQQIVKHKDDH